MVLVARRSARARPRRPRPCRPSSRGGARGHHPQSDRGGLESRAGQARRARARGRRARRGSARSHVAEGLEGWAPHIRGLRRAVDIGRARATIPRPRAQEALGRRRRGAARETRLSPHWPARARERDSRRRPRGPSAAPFVPRGREPAPRRPSPFTALRACRLPVPPFAGVPPSPGLPPEAREAESQVRPLPRRGSAPPRVRSDPARAPRPVRLPRA